MKGRKLCFKQEFYILTDNDGLRDLRTLIVPPLPSDPTAIKSPLEPVFGVTTDPLLWPRLHHFPKYRFAPSGPSNPLEKHISPGILRVIMDEIMSESAQVPLSKRNACGCARRSVHKFC